MQYFKMRWKKKQIAKQNIRNKKGKDENKNESKYSEKKIYCSKKMAVGSIFFFFCFSLSDEIKFLFYVLRLCLLSYKRAVITCMQLLTLLLWLLI